MMVNNGYGYYVCDWCGKTFTTKPYDYGGFREYCSKRCYLAMKKHESIRAVKK